MPPELGLDGEKNSDCSVESGKEAARKSEDAKTMVHLNSTTPGYLL